MVRLETSLRYSSLLIKALSFSQSSSKVSNLEEAANFAYYLFIVLIEGLMFIQGMIYIIQNSTGVLFITERIPILIVFLQATVNLILYRYNRKKVFKLIKDVNNMLQNGSPELKKHLGEYGKMVHIVYLVCMAVLLIAIIYMVLEALINGNRALPVPVWYPFDYKESSFHFRVACFHQTIVLTYAGFLMGIDVMFAVLVHSCCIRYRLLQNMLREVAKSDNSKRQRKPAAGIGIDLDKRISKLVDLHCELLDTLTDINDVYTYILFVLFVTSVILMCANGFQITNGDNKQSVNSFVIAMSGLSSNVFQILYYFLPGDMLGHEAFAVQMAAYDSGWESMPIKYKKQILLVMFRSTNSPTLNIARLMPVTLENYGSFMANAFSYFTSLRAVAGVS